MVEIIARHEELTTLRKLLDSGKPEFLAIYGRRRVGKTFLIREFFQDKGTFFHVTGVKDAPLKKQISHFVDELKRVFAVKVSKSPKNWQDAFTTLRDIIEKKRGTERIILFFDELPWLSTHRSGFLQDLDHFWNRYMSTNNRVIMVVCGSAASWMIQKVIHHKGGLHGRLTALINLKPFDLSETEMFLRSQNVSLDRKQIIDLYMAIGGIPKYLTYVDRGLSSAQIINKICFNGPLTDEFDELYASLFGHHEHHMSIIRALAERTQGLTKGEISELTGLNAGGGMNSVLEDLEHSGFISLIPDLVKRKKDIRYRLSDEYSLFYIRWIERAKHQSIGGIDPNYWLTVLGSPESRTWAGYSFEGICLKHVSRIKEALGISGVLTQAAGWIFKPARDSDQKGCQIDLLIDRADNCVNLCEVKFSNDLYVISKSYEAELRRKKTIFLEKTGTKKTVFLTLITPYGVSKSAGYFGVVDKELTMNNLFGGA